MSEFLEVRWARTHNLKNIDVKIPKNTLSVITGISWSGKSSLAFSTIYSIGQQKYLESLSSYARMFVGNKSDEALYDEIIGLSPTISIDQKTTNRNPRSTVGTITEIYDYYKILYLNIGKRKCVSCGSFITKDSIKDIVAYIASFPVDTKYYLSFPILQTKENLTPDIIKSEVLDTWFIRFLVNDVEYTVNQTSEIKIVPNMKVDIIADRLKTIDDYWQDLAQLKRLKDSLELCFKLWKWQLSVHMIETSWELRKDFSQGFVCSHCWHKPEKLSISSFSFNSHQGACPDCHGLWEKMVFLEENIVNQKLCLDEGAVIAPGFWNYFLAQLEVLSQKHTLRLNTPYHQLSDQEKNLVMYGTGNDSYTVSFINEQGKKNTYNSRFEGVIPTLTRRYFDGGAEHGSYESFVTNICCPWCNGHRLQKESLSVYIWEKNIWELSELSVTETQSFFENLSLSKEEQYIIDKVLKNIVDRLEFLQGVWLSYMSIARKSWTLSGGEAQRIRLATQIWVKLEWIIYVLDEPSIWLHPRDNDMLIGNLKKLRDIGNTLIVVEHDEDIMREADYIIDIWPWAWIHGGRVVAEGDFASLCLNPHSVTGPYLSGQKHVHIDKKHRDIFHHISIRWASHHNLKNIDVDIPIWVLTAITWVSWSGKSSLINDILAKYLANTLNRAHQTVWACKSISGVEHFDKVLIIDQSPIWKTPRSNPATYTGVFTFIREVFAASYEAKIRWYGPWRFSFNTKQWRCQECDGDGVKKVEMHFLPPVYVVCEVCEGRRYNPETLEIRYKGKDISDVLSMTIDEASQFFHAHPRIIKVLWLMQKVWLWYLQLWQSSTTLSWGEAQRIKLATELSKRSSSKTIYILDEPTTWLHFQDVQKLLQILHSLVDRWNTVIVIEHNMNIILNADYIIDIWPEWGDAGGNIVVAWDLETVKKCTKSYTWQAIKKYLSHYKK